MSTLLREQPAVGQAYEKYQQFNHDARMRALDEAHQRFLHDQATDIEEAHQKGEAKGRIEGRTEGKAEMVLTALRAKFKQVPKDIERSVLVMSDSIALESLLVQAIHSETLDEFAETLR